MQEEARQEQNGFFSSASFPFVREELFPKKPFKQAISFVHTNRLMGLAPCMLVKYSEYQLCPKKTYVSLLKHDHPLLLK